MQSVNGEVEEMYGLVRNIPFTMRDIMLFFQVHVIWSPVYDILLGRPFDILTESGIKNFKNEDQIITITNLNTSCILTVPTNQRGQPKYAGHRKVLEELVFQSRLMN